MFRPDFERYSAHTRAGGVRVASVLLGLLAGFLWWTPLLNDVRAQETGQITGTIVQEQSGSPVSGVQVYLSEGDHGTLSQSNGRFVLLNVPTGTHTVVAERIGFESGTRTVTVGEGETVQLEFALSQTALALDEVVVTGTPGAQTRREIGNVVGNIDASVAETAPIENVSDLLRGREAGVVVNRGQGAPGTAAVIRIRGQASMSADNQPLIYVDGIRVNDRMSSPQGGNTASAISRIDDFSPSEIESVEVIKGPAASTLYGTEAAHGVIHIITKSGSFDQASEWTFGTRQGVNWFHDPARRTPTNYGIHPETGEIVGFNMVQYEKERGNDLFSYGRTQEYSASLSGGSSNVRYFLSGSAVDEEGVTPESWLERYNLRANIGAVPGENITIDANTGFTLLSARVPGRGTTYGAMRSIFLARPEVLDTPREGYYRAPPDAMYEMAQFYQDSYRTTAGITVNHDALDWFDHRLTVGLDLTDQRSTRFSPHLSPYAAQFWPPRQARGEKRIQQESVLQTSFDYSASVRRSLGAELASTTSSGLQVNTKRIDLATARGEEFPAPGVESIGGAATTFGTSDVLENNTVGLYLQQQLGWRDRLFVTAAIRADDNSAFGEEFSLVYYPKLSTSWVVSDEDFWGVESINSLRLRAAYGESGQQPDVFDALRSFDPRPQPDGSPAVTPSAPGNPSLGPERGQEIEVGWDAVLLDERLTFDFTFYDQTTKDAIVARDVSPSSGFTDRRFVNIGEVSNRGVEAALNARVIDRRALDWDIGLNLSTNRNRIEKLGLEGFLGLGWTTRHVEGYPVASMWGYRVVSADVNYEEAPENAPGWTQVENVLCDDGQGGAIDCSEAPAVYAGHPDPNVEGSLSTMVGFLEERVRLQVMSDFKLGQSNYSTQGWWRYGALPVAEELWHWEDTDPRVLGVANFGGGREFTQWVGLDASYWRLREVALSATLPGSWLSRVGAARGQASLSAHNLAMLWTAYPSYPHQDPEMRSPARLLSREGEPENTAMVPPLQSVTLGLRLTF